ncbi:MAG: ROK family protein [Microbacterium sp.]
MAVPAASPGTALSAASELFQLLRDGEPHTRAALAHETGLARSTIAARVDELMKLGLVCGVDDGVSTGGRPPSRFAMNPAGGRVLAVDFGASHLTVGVTDMMGTVIAHETISNDVADGPEIVLERVTSISAGLLSGIGGDGELVAVGVGVPGPVEHSTGRLSNPPIMPGWHDFDIPGWLGQRLHAPVLVDNDVNVMALGERFRACPGVDHLIFVKVATGIGAGIISDGRLQRGARGSAGDIGHIRLARGSDVPCRCGSRGCLEALASGPGIARALRAQGVDAADGQSIIELVKRGDLDAIQAVRQAGRDIGEVLTSGVSFVNPSMIIIGGSMSQVGEHLLAGVREVIYTRSTPITTEHLMIAQSEAAELAGVIGAGILAIDHVLSPAGIVELSKRRAS